MKVILNLLMVFGIVLFFGGINAVVPGTLTMLLSGVVLAVFGIAVLRKNSTPWNLAGFIVMALGSLVTINSLSEYVTDVRLVSLIAFAILLLGAYAARSRFMVVASAIALSTVFDQDFTFSGSLDPISQTVNTLSLLNVDSVLVVTVVFFVLAWASTFLANRLARTFSITSIAIALTSLFNGTMAGAKIGAVSAENLELQDTINAALQSTFLPMFTDGVLVLPAKFMLVLFVIALLILGALAKRNNSRTLFITVVIAALIFLYLQWFQYLGGNQNLSLLGGGLLAIVLALLFSYSESLGSKPALPARPVINPAKPLVAPVARKVVVKKVTVKKVVKAKGKKK